ncbi:N-acetylneuraminate synthase [Brevibacillus sp. SYSU BS000544]|uniref:N-acetylneuraminate synthase n=1 Tax=Brevibacillus sp. SYSU BS000544 TaxID=3416443 RepID=UPI003CE4EFDB
MRNKTKRTYIIAEAGVNHNGSIDMAFQLIDAAKKAGADAVKFQTFKAKELVTKNAFKAEYQLKTTQSEQTQYEMLKNFELDQNAHNLLIEHCKRVGIQFLSTPFDMESAELLIESLNIPIIKIPSGEITNAPLLLQIARRKKKMILSTGMSTLADIELALGVIAYGLIQADSGKPPSFDEFQSAYSSFEGQAALKEYVNLLHCTSEYPTPYNEVNLQVMDTLRYAFQLPVGLSDHTEGICVPIAAVARGAAIIEKHFTLDRTLPGPDHQASLEPDNLKQMIDSIRQVEQALGTYVKFPTESEKKNKDVVRKYLVAARSIKKGERFSEENLTSKRTTRGISPINYWDYLGREAQKDYDQDDVIEE